MSKNNQSVGMIESLAEFKELKNIDKETMINVLSDSFRSVLAKMFGSDDNFDVIVNPENGDFEIWRSRTVVADDAVTDENKEVGITEARTIDPEAEEDDEVTDSVDFLSFGRRAILTLRQTLSGKILELQKEHFYNTFVAKIGKLISAEVYQIWKRETLLLDDEGNELLMPKSEQIPGDFFRKGDTVHAVVERVDNENNNPKVIVSRTSPEFLKRLFELNVPEIADGLITIKRVARIPGERAKMAVESYDERIDPVGACVGMNGSRIRGIVRELKGENIDVMAYTNNLTLLVQRALSPAKASSIDLFEEEQKAEVYLKPEEVPLAIGKNASNIKLASALTGLHIEVYRDIDETVATEEDIYLSEFSDEIDAWVIDALQAKALNTARVVLARPREELIKEIDLEEKTVDHVLKVLASEFEPHELQDMQLPSSNKKLLASALEAEAIKEEEEMPKAPTSEDEQDSQDVQPQDIATTSEEDEIQ